MIKRILCPVDFSDASRRAARYALTELAPQLNAEVVLVSVLESSDIRVALDAGLFGFASDEDLHRKVEEWVEQQYAKVHDITDVRTKRDIRRGMPEREILDAIREHAPDLVVMGANGIADRTPFGTKTEHVLRYSAVPVLLLKAK